MSTDVRTVLVSGSQLLFMASDDLLFGGVHLSLTANDKRQTTSTKPQIPTQMVIREDRKRQRKAVTIKTTNTLRMMHEVRLYNAFIH